MTRRPPPLLLPAQVRILLAGLALVLSSWVGLASAQDEMDPLARIEALHAQARQAYEDLELEAAQTALRTALRLANTQGIESKSLARIHLMLGVVLSADTQSETPVEEQFRAALAIDPALELDPSLANSTLERLFARARRSLAPAPPPRLEPPPPPPPLPPPTPAGALPTLVHRRVPQAYEGVNIPIFVEVQGSPGAVQRVVLRYRRAGGPWNEVDLVPQTGDGASGYIPGSSVVGDWIEYEIEATDWAGQLVASVGSQLQPLRVSVVQARLPGLDDVGGSPLFGGAEPSPDRIVHLLLGVGTGVGIARKPPLRRPEVLIEEGFAPTIFHTYGELGFFPTQALMLLLAFRGQLIFEREDGALRRTIFEPLFSLRGRWMLDRSSPVRAFLGAGGGWCGFVDDCGYVQHSVSLEPQYPITDTTREGNAHAGIEGGLIFDLAPHVGLQFDLFLYALFGEKSSFQTDLNTGLVFSF